MEVINIRELRGMLSKRNKKDWHRLIGEAKEIRLPGNQSPFEIVRGHLMKFKPLRLHAKYFAIIDS